MEKIFFVKNEPLYVVGVAYGRNFNRNVYARLLISNNASAKGSDFSREIAFDAFLDKQGSLENAEFTQEINEYNIPSYRKVVSIREPLFWGRGDLVEVHHAPVGIKNNKGTVTKIRTTFVPIKDSEAEYAAGIIDLELYNLFNREGALYYPSDEYKKDSKSILEQNFPGKYFCIGLMNQSRIKKV